MDIVSILVVALVTFLAIIAGSYAYGMAHIREIKENWVKYRCNPVYMPLAGAVGSDIFTNFTYCVMQSVHTYAGFVLDPIYQNFEIFTSIFTGILSSMQFIRKKMAGTVDAFLSIVASIYGKIQNTMNTSLQLVGRIRTIMNRIISVFVIMLHIARTGIDSGMSVSNGPIGKVAEFFCFDPNTPIVLEDGKRVRMKDVPVGQKLAGGRTVISTMVFWGMDTPMVDIMGVRVSENHKILHEGRWIPCWEHPDAEETGKIAAIQCLTTSDHKIEIGEYTFKDYEETDDVEEFYKDVMDHYNAGEVPFDRSNYRATGVHPFNTKIRMEDGSLRVANDVHLLDKIARGGKVLGLIMTKLPMPYMKLSDGLQVAPGTMVFKENGLTVAADDEYAPLDSTVDRWVINYLTENALVVAVDSNGKEWLMLDDQEVPTTGIHEKRDKKVLGR